MTAHIYVDETKAKGYLVVAATGSNEQLRLARRELADFLLPGQRSLHMKHEKDPRKRAIADTIVGLGLRAVVYDAGRAGTERVRRDRCFRALLGDAADDAHLRVVFDRDETLVSSDRQTLLELTRITGLRERVNYTHMYRREEPLLIIPDAIAWCWARGSHWRQRIRPVVSAAYEV